MMCSLPIECMKRYSLTTECVLFAHNQLLVDYNKKNPCGAQEVEDKLRKHELTKLEASIKDLTGHCAKLNR